ncbi:MAG: putative transrane protein [Polaromonas sp.]|nr:putative transrane protein [Polaromonas sp.]
MLHSPPAFRFATLPDQTANAQGAPVLWLLKRHSFPTPIRLVWVCLSLCLVASSLAGFFWWQGSMLMMTCALIGLLAISSAFVLHARHAGDAEKIVLQDGRLVIELESAGRTERAEFKREWVRVEPRHGDGSLIEVSGQGRSVRVGRHMRPELRPLLAREIRIALRSC